MRFRIIARFEKAIRIWHAAVKARVRLPSEEGSVRAHAHVTIDSDAGPSLCSDRDGRIYMTDESAIDKYSRIPSIAQTLLTNRKGTEIWY